MTAVDTATAANRWYPAQPPADDLTTPAGLLKDGLQRRMRGMHALWLEALATMNADHVNHSERSGVLPIAFTVNHQVRLEDASCGILAGRAARWNTGDWANQTNVTVDNIGKDTTVAEMELQRIGDYGAFCDYAHLVYADTETWLDELPPERLTEVLFGGSFPSFIQNAYIHRVVRDDTVLMVDAIECWIYQHGIRHLGELEHARALVGLGGLTS
ncbi:MAG: hypothetical protein ACR2LQ_03415 [Acidimicrobiales bacterium]